MSEINTKIFKPQKWVLDVLNSPIGDNTESLIKISDKVPEDMGKAIYFYTSDSEGVRLTSDILTEITPSVYFIDGLLILTDNIDGKSKGIYILEEFYETVKESGITELYLIFQTTQDFSISKKTIEGKVHPIEEKYIPGGGGGGQDLFLNYYDDGGDNDYVITDKDNNDVTDNMFDLVQENPNLILKSARIRGIGDNSYYSFNDNNESYNYIASCILNLAHKDDNVIVYSGTTAIISSMGKGTVIFSYIIRNDASNYGDCTFLGNFVVA